MDGVLSQTQQHRMELVASFLDIAVGQTADTALKYLQATSWSLDKAIQLFLGESSAPSYNSMVDNNVQMLRDLHLRDPRVSGPEQGSSHSSAADSLVSSSRPKFASRLRRFEQASVHAKKQNKWLVVNVQSVMEFSCYVLNRDTWADKAVAKTIKSKFVFWQIYDDIEEGRKICTFYQINTVPAVLVIDPITGQKMHSWHGIVEPKNFLKDLVPFMHARPSANHISLRFRNRQTENLQATASHDVLDENTDEDEELQRKVTAFLEERFGKENGGTTDLKRQSWAEVVRNPNNRCLRLPEEPKGDKISVCRIGIRLPDGSRVQRNFLRADPIQLLWSFCYSELKEEGGRPFRLILAIPGASKTLDYNADSTFQESGLANSMISVAWE